MKVFYYCDTCKLSNKGPYVKKFDDADLSLEFKCTRWPDAGGCEGTCRYDPKKKGFSLDYMEMTTLMQPHYDEFVER